MSEYASITSAGEVANPLQDLALCVLLPEGGAEWLPTAEQLEQALGSLIPGPLAKPCKCRTDGRSPAWAN